MHEQNFLKAPKTILYGTALIFVGHADICLQKANLHDRMKMRIIVRSCIETIEKKKKIRGENMICPNCGKEFSDDTRFCTNCGCELISSTSEEETPDDSDMTVSPWYSRETARLDADPPVETLPPKKKGKGKTIALIAVAALLAVSLAGNAYFGTQYSSKVSELTKANSQLKKAKNELSDTELQLEESESALTQAQDEITELESQVESLESSLSSAQSQASSLSNAGNIVNGISSFINSVPERNYQQYADIYCYSNSIIIKEGQTEEIYVVWANSGTITSNCSNTSVVSAKWSDGWAGNRATLKVTGLKAGTAKITFTNSYNDRAVEVLVIVTE